MNDLIREATHYFFNSSTIKVIPKTLASGVTSYEYASLRGEKTYLKKTSGSKLNFTAVLLGLGDTSCKIKDMRLWGDIVYEIGGTI